MNVHDSRDWSAKEGTDFAGGNRQLTVLGEVQVGGGNEEPVLTRATPQGINPTVLILDLSTRTTGDVGHDALLWLPARYEEAVEAGQYQQVEIRGHATVDVERVIS